MNIEFSDIEFRRLLDLVYVGDWVINSIRGADRIQEFDNILDKLFSVCEKQGLTELYQKHGDRAAPSRAFETGGIHEVIADYEDAIFFDILAEELARRDIQQAGNDPDDVSELRERIDNYVFEFAQNGVDNLKLDM